MPAAKGRKVVQILAALAVLAAVALPAGASIPRPGQLPGLNPETLLPAAREAPAPQPTANPQDASFELFAEPAGDRFRLDLHAAAEAPAEARFHLLTPRKTRVRGFRLPEPLVIGVELPPSRTAFRLYGDVPYSLRRGVYTSQLIPSDMSMDRTSTSMGSTTRPTSAIRWGRLCGSRE